MAACDTAILQKATIMRQWQEMSLILMYVEKEFSWDRKTPQVDLYIQCNHYQNSNCPLYRNWF